MLYVGIDVHKRNCVACILDPQTGKVENVTFPTTQPAIEAFAKEYLNENTIAALEATSGAYFVYDILEGYAKEVIMLHPDRRRRRSNKSDRTDALQIAKDVARGVYTRCWVPPKEIRELRRVLSIVDAIRKQIIATKNRLHAILREEGISLSSKDIFSKKGLQELEEKEKSLSSIVALCLHLLRQDAKWLQEKMDSVRKWLSAKANGNPDVDLLLTIPGVDFYAALVILAEIGDIQRFPSPKKLASYAGLVPSLNQSGDKAYQGGITKTGRKRLRWVMVQVANNAVKTPGKLREFYLRLKAKKEHNKAIVACARKLLCIIWCMLQRRETYWDAVDRLTRKKKRALEKKDNSFVPPTFSVKTLEEILELLNEVEHWELIDAYLGGENQKPA